MNPAGGGTYQVTLLGDALGPTAGFTRRTFRTSSSPSSTVGAACAHRFTATWSWQCVPVA